jgi:Sec-independent protein translocase protein TatA
MEQRFRERFAPIIIAMFGLSGTEIFVVVLCALLVFGPGKIPEIARAIKTAYRELTRVRIKVDETLTELRQEMDLNLDAPEHRPALTNAAGDGDRQLPPAVKTGAQTLPVPEEDDYMAPGLTATPAQADYSTEDYLREAGS